MLYVSARVQLVALLLFIFNQVATSRQFFLARTLRPVPSKKENKKEENQVKNCLNLRGGGKGKDEDGKIKGTCIGIDLGTTYR